MPTLETQGRPSAEVLTKDINVRGILINHKESRRLHIDWWGKCWTCRFWTGDMSGTGDLHQHAVLRKAPCSNPESEQHGQVVTTNGYCPKWVSWDENTGLELMMEWEEAKAKGTMPPGE